MLTGVTPLDEVFGDVSGRLTVVGGEPGSGKSFLLAFIAARILFDGTDVVWVGYSADNQEVSRVFRFCENFGHPHPGPRLTILRSPDFSRRVHLQRAGTNQVLFIDDIDCLCQFRSSIERENMHRVANALHETRAAGATYAWLALGLSIWTRLPSSS